MFCQNIGINYLCSAQCCPLAEKLLRFCVRPTLLLWHVQIVPLQTATLQKRKRTQEETRKREIEEKQQKQTKKEDKRKKTKDFR